MSYLTRRQMVVGVVASVLAATGLEACARRAPSVAEMTPVAAAPTVDAVVKAARVATVVELEMAREELTALPASAASSARSS